MLSYHPEGYWSHCVRRESFREMMMMLAPVSEEPKVTFAGRYVKGEGNSYAALDTVNVKFIPHVSEYSSADKHDMWYTNDEVKAMKKNAIRDIDVRKEEMKSKTNQYHNHQQQQQQQHQHQQQYTCDIRGLERLVVDGANNDCVTRRYEALHAILQEQYGQRCSIMYSSVNNPGRGGIIINSDDDDLRHERIRQVCMARGETIRSQEIALGLAKQDEAEANEYLQVKPEDEELDDDDDDDDYDKNDYDYDDYNNDDHDDKRDDKDTASTMRQQQQEQEQQEQQYQETKIPPLLTGRTNLRNNNNNGTKKQKQNPSSKANGGDYDCCWCVDVVDVVGRSLLLHALLAPFIKLHREESFFLE